MRHKGVPTIETSAPTTRSPEDYRVRWDRGRSSSTRSRLISGQLAPIFEYAIMREWRERANPVERQMSTMESIIGGSDSRKLDDKDNIHVRFLDSAG